MSYDSVFKKQESVNRFLHKLQHESSNHDVAQSLRQLYIKVLLVPVKVLPYKQV